MRLQLKMIAAAAALAIAGGANAAESPTSSGNGSLILYAYNTATTGYYLRDLGVLLNSFLPSSILPVAGDNPAAGDKTPDAGLNIPFAADSTFSTWLGGATSILWGIAAGDSLNAGVNGVARLLFSSDGNPNPSNGIVTNAVGGTLFGGTTNFTPASGSIAFASGVTVDITSAGGLGSANLTDLGSSASLYYYTRTVQGTAATATLANETLFQNGTNVATLRLFNDGSVVYNLDGAVAAVPLPAAAWLMGAGLMGLAGVARRRKTAKQA